MDALLPLTFWHWLTLSLFFGVAEMLLPGFVLLWFSAGALTTALALGILPDLSWQAQLVIFSLTSVSSLLLWWTRLRKHPTPTESPNLNRRGSEHIGQVYAVSEAIKNGVGRVRVGESSWRALGPDTDVGQAVKVIGVQGASLEVEAVP